MSKKTTGDIEGSPTKGKEMELVGGWNITPENFDKFQKMAELIASSDIVPKDFKGKPGNVIVAIQMGTEVGLAPMQALQSIAVISGRPGLFGGAPLALVRRSGLLEIHKEEWDAKTQTATVTVKRRGDPDPITHTFSMEDAKKIKQKRYKNGQAFYEVLADKDTYKNFPRRMCTFRSRGFCLWDKFPDVLKGLAPAETLDGISDDAIVDTTATPTYATPKPASGNGAPAAPAPALDPAPAESDDPIPQDPPTESPPESEEYDTAEVSIRRVAKMNVGNYTFKIVYVETIQGVAKESDGFTKSMKLAAAAKEHSSKGPINMAYRAGEGGCVEIVGVGSYLEKD